MRHYGIFFSEGCFFIQFLRSLAKRLFIIVEKKTVQGAKGKEDADKILRQLSQKFRGKVSHVR